MRREVRGRAFTLMLLVLALAVLPAERIQAAERALTLEDAIALALEKYEEIRIERQGLASADAAMSGARGAYDPILELQGGWRLATEPLNSAFSGAPSGRLFPTTEITEAGGSVSQLLPTGGGVTLRMAASRETTDGAFSLLSPVYGTRVGLELRQPLLRNRSMDAARLTIRIAASDRDRAVASLRIVVSETVAAVERAYWRLIAARLEGGVQEEAVRLAEEQLGETRVRIENGVAPETEISQPRAELERRRGEMLAAREELARAENALKLLILDDSDEARWMDTLVPTDEPAVQVHTIDTAASLQAALATRPELEEAQAAIERRRAQTAFAIDGVRPGLDAVVSYDRYGLAGSENPDGTAVPGLSGQIPPELEGGLTRSLRTLGEGDFDDTRVALVFGIPIGNRTARAAAVSARYAELQSETRLALARKEIRAEVLDAAAALETASQRIEATRAAREAAEVQLSSERDRYSVGLSTNFLVLTRQNDLSRARLAEIEALTDYRTSRSEMARSTGSLLADRGIEMETR